jgi:hemoglobin/transferrin/lactoferrin receptor protein
MMNTALYFSHTWNIADKFMITDGIRGGLISLHSTIADNSFFSLPYTKADQSNFVYSGSLGLIHTPSDDTKLSFLVSTGFRAPNVDDLSKIFESASGAVIVPNPDLKPEKTITYEAGLTKIFNKNVIWESSVYYTDFVDAIVTDKFKFNGQDSILYGGSMSQVLANQNKGKAYLYGFSSTLKAKCSDNITLSLGMNYTYGRIKTDSMDYPLDHIAPFMARFQVSYTKHRFKSDFFVNYQGSKSLNNYYKNGEDNEQYATAEGMPAWFTANLHLSYKVHKLVTVNFGVDNIFDTQYRVFASGINGPGRNIFASVKFHY